MTLTKNVLFRGGMRSLLGIAVFTYVHLPRPFKSPSGGRYPEALIEEIVPGATYGILNIMSICWFVRLVYSQKWFRYKKRCLTTPFLSIKSYLKQYYLLDLTRIISLFFSTSLGPMPFTFVSSPAVLNAPCFFR